MERAVILSTDALLYNPLPAAAKQSVSFPPRHTTLREAERALILRTLGEVGWLIGGTNGAAARLDIKRTTLIARMKKLGIVRPREHIQYGDIEGLCNLGGGPAEDAVAVTADSKSS